MFFFLMISEILPLPIKFLSTNITNETIILSIIFYSCILFSSFSERINNYTTNNSGQNNCNE